MFFMLLLALALMPISIAQWVSPMARCNYKDEFCNPLYNVECCYSFVKRNKAGDYALVYGSFCNMEGAVTAPGMAMPVGCCQKCNGEMDDSRSNCFNEDGGVTICCPGYTKQTGNPECSEGQYSCVRNETQTEVQNIKDYKCYTEGEFCQSTGFLVCCNGTICDFSAGLEGDYGTCQPDPDYTGPVPPPNQPIDLPTVPLGDTCKSKTSGYPIYVPPTTLEPPTTPEPLTTQPPMKCRVRTANCTKTWYNPLTWLCYLIGWGW